MKTINKPKKVKLEQLIHLRVIPTGGVLPHKEHWDNILDQCLSEPGIYAYKPDCDVQRWANRLNSYARYRGYKVWRRTKGDTVYYCIGTDQTLKDALIDVNVTENTTEGIDNNE